MNESIDVSFIANADLSTKQFRFVKMTTTEGKVDVCAATTDSPIGILQNKPTAGQAAQVRILGISKVSADAALTVGDAVASSADGQAATCVIGTDTTKYPVGRVYKATSAVDQLAEVILLPIARGA